jgi:hypothetical protein
MPDVDLSVETLKILLALRSESPWRFGNGIVEVSVAERFGDPFVALDRLMRLGFVSYEFYATGAVHEFSITESGRDAVLGPTP